MKAWARNPSYFMMRFFSLGMNVLWWDIQGAHLYWTLSSWEGQWLGMKGCLSCRMLMTGKSTLCSSVLDPGCWPRAAWIGGLSFGKCLEVRSQSVPKEAVTSDWFGFRQPLNYSSSQSKTFCVKESDQSIITVSVALYSWRCLLWVSKQWLENTVKLWICLCLCFSDIY